MPSDTTTRAFPRARTDELSFEKTPARPVDRGSRPAVGVHYRLRDRDSLSDATPVAASRPADAAAPTGSVSEHGGDDGSPSAGADVTVPRLVTDGGVRPIETWHEMPSTKRDIMRVVAVLHDPGARDIQEKLHEFAVNIRTATVYMHVNELDQAGFVAVDESAPRHTYSLTNLGTAVLEARDAIMDSDAIADGSRMSTDGGCPVRDGAAAAASDESRCDHCGTPVTVTYVSGPTEAYNAPCGCNTSADAQ